MHRDTKARFLMSGTMYGKANRMLKKIMRYQFLMADDFYSDRLVLKFASG